MMNHRVLGIVAGAVFSILVVGCNDPAKNAPKAETATAQPVSSHAAKTSTTYAFSANGSKLEFVGAKITDKHEGAFGAFDGTVQLTDGDPSKSAVTVEISMDSLQIEPEKLAGHLKSPDFFDVAKHPKAKFTSTSIRPGGDNGATHTITGNLELHGVVKSITFPATISVVGDGVNAKAEFAINRKDFGIVYPGMPDDLIKDNVLIRLNIRGKQGGNPS